MDYSDIPLQSWSIGMMCYNEVDSIENTFKDILSVATLISTEFEIIIVDDGSNDGSKEIIQKISANYPNVVPIFHIHNLGIGHTLRSIYLNAKMENVANVPGDGQFDVSMYLKTKNIPDNSFVAFYRKENIGYNTRRNLLSHLNRLLNKYIIGLKCKDINWTKIYKTRDIIKINPKMTSSLVETEICAKLNLIGKSMIELESKYLPRTFGKSKGSTFFIIYQAGLDIFKLIIIITVYRFLIKLGLNYSDKVKEVSNTMIKKSTSLLK